jgi:hypothetical protein
MIPPTHVDLDELLSATLQLEQEQAKAGEESDMTD